MDKSSSTLDQVKDGVGTVVDRAREAVNDGIDSVKGTINNGVDNFDRLYRSTVTDVRETSGRIAENAREQLDDVKHFARKKYRHGRKKVSRLSGDVGDYVSDNPGRSLLIAAGIGFLAGLVIRHRGGATESVVTTRLPRPGR